MQQANVKLLCLHYLVLMQEFEIVGLWCLDNIDRNRAAAIPFGSYLLRLFAVAIVQIKPALDPGHDDGLGPAVLPGRTSRPLRALMPSETKSSIVRQCCVYMNTYSSSAPTIMPTSPAGCAAGAVRYAHPVHNLDVGLRHASRRARLFAVTLLGDLFLLSLDKAICRNS